MLRENHLPGGGDIDVGDGGTDGAIAPLENFKRAKLIRTGQVQVILYFT